jgi:AcrR family transcriptional regulator
MEGEIDRRVVRTRRALHEALIRLIKRKGYDALTVQEIIDEADIGRATFYAHYRGKDDLLRGGFERLRGELKAARRETRQGERDQPLTFSLAMFEHACAYRDVYRAMLGGQGSIIAINEIRRVLAELVKEDLWVANWQLWHKSPLWCSLAQIGRVSRRDCTSGFSQNSA